MIQCPKCAHQQTNPEECESCGLIFSKFERAQARKKETEIKQEEQQPKGAASMSRLASALALVVLSSALTYYFVGGTSRQGETGNPPLPIASETDDSPASAPAPLAVPPPKRETDHKTEMLKASPVIYAKNGTVAIETPWGKGSGFFISDTCIVTNKHVIEPDRQQLAEFRHEVENNRKLITLEQEKIAEIRRQMAQMKAGPTRQQLAIILQEKEKELTKVLPMQEESEKRLKSMEKPLSSSDIKIFLADGSEYAAESSRVSPKRDLALLAIYAARATVLQAAPKNSTLSQGDKVYTIGNPVGLRNTVTAGIFSGYRQREDTKEIFLQTDAPTNPGNSGGPLIDERGFVHGVNTMIIKDTQGIGFAIPIQAVFEEFAISQN
jgi:S1-C subfamily serine protease